MEGIKRGKKQRTRYNLWIKSQIPNQRCGLVARRGDGRDFVKLHWDRTKTRTSGLSLATEMKRICWIILKFKGTFSADDVMALQSI